MGNKKYTLVADISTEDPKRIEPVLTELVGVNAILRTDDGFKVKTTMEGESARELNRLLLSALRRVDNGTILHAEWTRDGTIERFFGYEAKGIRKGQND